MDEERLNHTRWECKYHIIWIPKYRRKELYGQVRREMGEVLHSLARHKESRILEGPLQLDHVRVLMAIPPKYSVAQIVVIYERKECDPHCKDISGATEELYRDAFLGPWLLCIDRGGG